MEEEIPPAPPIEVSKSHRLAEVAGLFLRLGFTAFGGPAAHIAMMRQEIVQRRKWISDERLIDLISIMNLIPGPNSTELAISLGYIRAGWPGLIVAGVCFIGPAMLIVLALAWLYVRFGSLPQTDWILYGIKAVVIAIIAQALWGLSRTIFKSVWPVCFALVILVLYLLNINSLVLLLAGGCLYGVMRLLLTRRTEGEKIKALALPVSLGPRVLAALKMLPFATIYVVDAVPVTLLQLFLSFLKIGAVIYGSGYVLLAFLRNEFVLGLGWLTDRQLLDAVSIGQFTPGPVFTTATFIGYLVAGVPGALLATLGIFLPSFIFVAAIFPLAGRLRSLRLTSALLDGVNVAALALMAGVLVQLGRSALVDPVTWIIALVSLAILQRFKINSAWLILAGALLGIIRFWLFK